MPLWGVGTNTEKKPVWLSDEEKERTYADDRGWVYVHPNGDEEVLVSIGNLAGTSSTTGLGAPTVDSVAFESTTVVQGENLILNVYFNEGVAVTGSPLVTISGLTADLTYSGVASTEDRGYLVFAGTTGTDSGVVTLDADTDITLNGGTITDAVDESTAAEVALNNDALTAEITT